MNDLILIENHVRFFLLLRKTAKNTCNVAGVDPFIFVAVVAVADGADADTAVKCILQDDFGFLLKWYVIALH